MIKSRKLFFAVLILIAATIAVTKYGNQDQWRGKLSHQAMQSKTSSYYAENRGGFRGSAAEWTREAFH